MPLSFQNVGVCRFFAFGYFLGQKEGVVLWGLCLSCKLDSSSVCLDCLVHKWCDAFLRIAIDRRHWNEVNSCKPNPRIFVEALWLIPWKAFTISWKTALKIDSFHITNQPVKNGQEWATVLLFIHFQHSRFLKESVSWVECSALLSLRQDALCMKNWKCLQFIINSIKFWDVCCVSSPKCCGLCEFFCSWVWDWYGGVMWVSPWCGGTVLCVQRGAQKPPWCVLAIQQIAASSSIFERQSINGCLARVGNVTCFLTTCWMGIWALWALLAAGLLKESNYLCVM